MAQEVSTRVQLALEQIGEDETLTTDLTDPAATALLEWITQQVQAADAAPDDAAFQQQVKAIRSAAKSAARTAADEDVTAAQVVERAQAALKSSAPPAAAESSAPAAQEAAAQPQPAESRDPVTAAASTPAAEVPAPAAPAASAPAVEAQAPDAAVIADSQRAQAARSGSLWNSLRRRLRRWTHRKV
ncbi:MAG TPA: hypothetical protein VGD58_28950 [Herpetosiphonaceae bacterium]